MTEPQAMPLHGARSQHIAREQVAPFRVDSEYTPAGDQPTAIAAITERLKQGERDTALLGVTGSGKTFTVAHTIQNLQRPALVLAHNKTLAAQLYSEMKSFFPDNAVEYFVSYYDYYQPEAYIAKTDTFIEKDSAINERIDLMRHSATRSLLERRDVIVVASVSCIYGIGSPDLYYQMTVKLDKGGIFPVAELKNKLVELSYQRNDIDFKRGSFRAQGDTVDIFPSHYEDRAWRLSFFGDEIDDICEFDPLTGERVAKLDSVTVYASSHYVTPRPTLLQAASQIKKDLNIRLEELYAANKLVEAQRLQQRTTFDMEMMRETGACKGIENYSRYLSGRNPGEPPPTLFEYLPEDALLFVDESHVTVPQIGGMYNGDRARKNNLVEHGFRLPSARDNRPMQFQEWDDMRPQTVFVSATPGKFEIERTEGEVIEQMIRPTGLPDPICIIRPVAIQVDDLIAEAKDMCAKNMRTLVTTLTKRMAEDLTDYLKENGLSVVYMHSDVKTLDRIEAIQKLRAGEYDILIGVNLLREGLDIPECGLMAIFDADKEGFLRSETALVQTIGRAARNLEGRVILYADKMTNSLTRALDETARRREIQIAHNTKHGIVPRGITKSAMQGFEHVIGDDDNNEPASASTKKALSYAKMTEKQRKAHIDKLHKEMTTAASDLDFEKAMRLRDEIAALEKALML